MSWGSYQNELRAKGDLRELKRLRKMDRRRRYTAGDLRAKAFCIRRSQMSLALHRAGLVSPHDYEYGQPRSKMSKLAIQLDDKYMAPFRALWQLEELFDMLAYELDWALPSR